MRAKSAPTIKRKKETYTKGTMSDEIVVKSSSNFTQEVLLLWGHTPSQKRIYSYFCTFCALFCELSWLTFTQKSRSLSLVKFAVVVVVVELFVLFARARGTKDEKRASSSRSPALFKKWNYS
jgi:hypothetical protein